MTGQTIIEQAKLPNETLFAWTSVGDYRYYPQFVNVSRKDGRIVISVRSLEDTTGEHPRTGSQAVATLPDEEVRRLVTALQSSAVLPSEAMVEAVNVVWFSQELHELFRKHFVAWGDSTDWEKIATGALNSLSVRAAMRATTPTAPVQDDDAEWRPIETMPKGARVEGDLGNGQTIIGRTVPRSKFGDHNTVTDANGVRHVVYRWRPL